MRNEVAYAACASCVHYDEDDWSAEDCKHSEFDLDSAVCKGYKPAPGTWIITTKSIHCPMRGSVRVNNDTLDEGWFFTVDPHETIPEELEDTHIVGFNSVGIVCPIPLDSLRPLAPEELEEREKRYTEFLSRHPMDDIAPDPPADVGDEYYGYGCVHCQNCKHLATSVKDGRQLSHVVCEECSPDNPKLEL